MAEATARQFYDKVYQVEKRLPVMGTSVCPQYNETKSWMVGKLLEESGQGRIKMLDLGMGNGVMGDHLHPRIDWYGADISPVGVLTAHRKYGERLSGCAANGLSLPYANGSFDAVAAADSLEHLGEDPSTAISEISRVLKNDGVLVATLPTPFSYRDWLAFYMHQGISVQVVKMFAQTIIAAAVRAVMSGDPSYQPVNTEFSTREWCSMLEKKGLHIEGVEEWPARDPVKPLLQPLAILLKARKSDTAAR